MPSPDQAPDTTDNPFAYSAAPLPSPTTEQRRFPSLDQSAALGSRQHTQSQAQVQLQIQRQSPQQQTRYFTRSASVSYQQALAAQMPGQQTQLQASAPPQQSSVTQTTQSGLDYVPDRRDAGATNAQTMAMLAEYNLLAEAAKRAQVACMIRDLDEMDMS